MGENMLYLGPIFELSINSIDFETVNRNGKSYNVEMDTWIGGNVGAMIIFGNARSVAS
ncbi:MAG: hypothetical protein IPJ75_12820 [Ignavibacteriales bacterium]|nr:hypothetical protein [Ignavibacteriales bacterium]